MAKKQSEIEERRKKLEQMKKEQEEKAKKDKEAREAQQKAAADSKPQVDDATLRNMKGKAVQDIRNCMLADDIQKIRTTIAEAKTLGVMEMPIAARLAQLLAKLEVVEAATDAVKLKAAIDDAKTLGIESPILAKAKIRLTSMGGGTTTPITTPTPTPPITTPSKPVVTTPVITTPVTTPAKPTTTTTTAPTPTPTTPGSQKCPKCNQPVTGRFCSRDGTKMF